VDGELAGRVPPNPFYEGQKQPALDIRLLPMVSARLECLEPGVELQ